MRARGLSINLQAIDMMTSRKRFSPLAVVVLVFGTRGRTADAVQEVDGACRVHL
jgi:hypothetical protein